MDVKWHQRREYALWTLHPAHFTGDSAFKLIFKEFIFSTRLTPPTGDEPSVQQQVACETVLQC